MILRLRANRKNCRFQAAGQRTIDRPDQRARSSSACGREQPGVPTGPQARRRSMPGHMRKPSISETGRQPDRPVKEGEGSSR